MNYDKNNFNTYCMPGNLLIGTPLSYSVSYNGNTNYESWYSTNFGEITLIDAELLESLLESIKTI